MSGCSDPTGETALSNARCRSSSTCRLTTNPIRFAAFLNVLRTLPSTVVLREREGHFVLGLHFPPPSAYTPVNDAPFVPIDPAREQQFIIKSISAKQRPRRPAG